MIPVQTLSTRIRKEADPLQLFRLFCQDGETNHRILFETADSADGQVAKSILLSKAALRIELKSAQFTIEALSLNGRALLEQLIPFLNDRYIIQREADQLTFPYQAAERDPDPLKQLRQSSVLEPLRLIQQLLQPDKEFAADLAICGVFSYDLVDYFEQLPAAEDFYDFPDFSFYVPEQAIRVDHETKQVTLFHFVFADNQSSPLVQDSLLEFNTAIDLLKQYRMETETIPELSTAFPDCQESLSDADYSGVIAEAQTAIRRGDVYQIVPSRRFSTDCPSAVDAYRKLRQSNPSPYMFYIRTDRFTLFGASPETAVKFEQNKRRVSLNPIAGTKARALMANGQIDADQDNRNEMDLLLNHKEIAEHIMLLDLARNDIAKISRPNSRRVSRMMQVEKYSHVMHLVSEVEGLLADD
ncbi:MAG: chorismate-binding protein, partial [Calditrichaeota bacterium]|nr:chorismate-binding protein [Calditrichota bacterium]